jgi:hypothetical protein
VAKGASGGNRGKTILVDKVQSWCQKSMHACDVRGRCCG